MTRVDELLGRWDFSPPHGATAGDIEAYDFLAFIRSGLADGSLKVGGAGGAMDLIRERLWDRYPELVRDFNDAYLADCRKGARRE